MKDRQKSKHQHRPGDTGGGTSMEAVFFPRMMVDACAG